jgi:hypothetical protein
MRLPSKQTFEQLEFRRSKTSSQLQSHVGVVHIRGNSAGPGKVHSPAYAEIRLRGFAAISSCSVKKLLAPLRRSGRLPSSNLSRHLSQSPRASVPSSN